MANEPLITLTGRVGKDPELKISPNGKAILNLSVAVTPRKNKDGEWVDGETMWFRVVMFGKDAEAATEKVNKGDKVCISGRLTINTFTNKDGEKVTVPEVIADALGIIPTITNTTKKDEGASWM